MDNTLSYDKVCVGVFKCISVHKKRSFKELLGAIEKKEGARVLPGLLEEVLQELKRAKKITYGGGFANIRVRPPK